MNSDAVIGPRGGKREAREGMPRGTPPAVVQIRSLGRWGLGLGSLATVEPVT